MYCMIRINIDIFTLTVYLLTKPKKKTSEINFYMNYNENTNKIV